MSWGMDPSLDYDYEDSPRYWGEKDINNRIIEEEIERRHRND